MKKCSKCRKKKLLTSFNKKGSGTHAYCKKCQSDYRKAHYQRDPSRYSGARDERRNRLQVLVDEKKDGPCRDCSNKFLPCAMDFDHRPGEGKVREVSRLVRDCAAEETILAEIEKCDLVCAVCHRIRTWKRNMAKRRRPHPESNRGMQIENLLS